MKTYRATTLVFGFLASLAALSAGGDVLAAENGYGSISGQFVLDGEIPMPVQIIKKDDPSVKDPTCCAAIDQFADDLIIDADTKGIQHVFIYLRKAEKVHPGLAKPKEEEVVFDQKNCRFTPHTLLVRTGQKVVVKSDDPIAHNTHTYPIRGEAANVLLRPNDREGIKMPANVGESLPTQVKCDIHPWMKAYWLVLDHPYMAVTDAKGKFTIKDLPEGSYEFFVWQERVGYLGAEKAKYSGVDGAKRGFSVTVKNQADTSVGVKVPVATFASE